MDARDDDGRGRLRWTSPETDGGAVSKPLGTENVYFNEVDRAGHFAACGESELFNREVRAAFKSLR